MFWLFHGKECDSKCNHAFALQLKCFAAVCQETAHIAELVARQKSSKKSGRSQVVNCRMRFKPSNPYMLNSRSLLLLLKTWLCFLNQGFISSNAFIGTEWQSSHPKFIVHVHSYKRPRLLGMRAGDINFKNLSWWFLTIYQTYSVSHHLFSSL